MQELDLAAPRAVAGIRNFGWVVPGVVARGEQPPLADDTFHGLHDLGISAVLSLRPHGEVPSPHRRISSPHQYDVEEERGVVERAGLRFAHAPLEDFSAPPPEELAAALRALDLQLETGPGVYVHCRAGAGRAGLVTGAWLIAHGGTGDQAVALYHSYLQHLGVQSGREESEWHSLLLRIGQPEVLWALQQIAHALGSPVSANAELLAPRRPEGADGWEARYWATLSPWRSQYPLRVPDGPLREH
ncbi:MAG TPA: tyrosine-protein phosphatase [Chloroflexota bacterium]|jgi:protein tyrosine phosphatase (PTP) superfamily phosphohydrolase (DUF442 family)